MLTYEKILDVFKEYLSEDKSCEVLRTSRGYLVVDWESCNNNWVVSRLCPTPELLRDVLRADLEEYQGYKLTDGYKRDVTEQEKKDIGCMGAEFAARCGKEQ